MDTNDALDRPLIDGTDPALARLLPERLRVARLEALAVAEDVLAISEPALARGWAWIGNGGETEVRYGAYRALEALERGETEARSIVAAADARETKAALIVGPATAARWDLHGLLVALPDGTLDEDPGGGEWTLRRTVGHVISGQRGYGWGTTWWLAGRHDAADLTRPRVIPDDAFAGLPDEDVEGEGSGAAIRARLDAILDLCVERLAGLPDESLGQGARWSGFPVTVAFRLGRWSSHLREHTIQVEKTLAMLGRTPTEPERLARLVLAAYGRAESAVFGRDPADAAVVAAVVRIADAAAEARDAVRAARNTAMG
jgi:hypothetical protein